MLSRGHLNQLFSHKPAALEHVIVFVLGVYWHSLLHLCPGNLCSELVLRIIVRETTATRAACPYEAGLFLRRLGHSSERISRSIMGTLDYSSGGGIVILEHVNWPCPKGVGVFCNPFDEMDRWWMDASQPVKRFARCMTVYEAVHGVCAGASLENTHCAFGANVEGVSTCKCGGGFWTRETKVWLRNHLLIIGSWFLDPRV